MRRLQIVSRKLNKFRWQVILKKIFSIKLLIVTLILLLSNFLLIPFTLKYAIQKEYGSNIYYDPELIPEQTTAIVFGAGLKDFGKKPGKILEDRVMAAVELYQLGKVKKIIMSGDNRQADYNEPAVMKDYAIKQGVREFDLIIDTGGIRTYDSCYRAKKTFGINQAILITQQYHLPRALYTCSSMGMEVNGYAADKNIYPEIINYQIREFLALTLSFWEIQIISPVVESSK